jgi:predicted branched-subunit amino acid permease
LLRIAAITAPAAAAIAVFGTIFGATARPLIGTPLTLLCSALIFSGALQFAVVGLLSAGATTLALLLTGATLNLRHLVLGAVLRRRLTVSTPRRAGLAWFLIDESFGFAIAAEDAERTLFVSGVICYLAWQAGTAVGVVGAEVPWLSGIATAVFPVLFIGLAAIAATDLPDAVRAVLAAAVTAILAYVAPGLRGFVPVIAAVVVALPGTKK